MSDKLEQLWFKLEKKILGFRNMQEKLENDASLVDVKLETLVKKQFRIRIQILF